ncbi:MAG TPA: dihydropteroate synthase [Ilumatobacter sp.]|nr:dihydropteroate synthase [Ilumatobacter sp.]
MSLYPMPDVPVVQHLMNATPVVLMGIINVTPDSFSDGNQFLDTDRAVNHAGRLAAQGAHVLDIGGESTRPGAEPVPVPVELERVIPVIEQLADYESVVCIDTRKAEVARRAIEAGARMINDVSGLRDPDMVAVAVDKQVPVVVMHTPINDPTVMQTHARYDDVVDAIVADLTERAQSALDAGVPEVIIDPGFGFGKTVEHNLEIIRRLREIVAIGHPVLVGASRKSFIGAVVGTAEPTARDSGSIVVHLACVAQGARFLRVHDVAGHRQSIAMAAAIRDVNRS